MSDKSNKYGYVGVDIPEQSFGANKGVFNPAEINELVADNKWTQYGQLELIETQTYSSGVTSVEFTDIKEDIYNVHFMTLNNLDTIGSDLIATRFSINGGSSYVSTGYQVASQYGNGSGTFGESRTTNNPYLEILSGNQATPQNAYQYFYNLGDSTKYSFQTFHSSSDDDSVYLFRFGSSVYPQANVVNAIQVLTITSQTLESFDISLYGIRYS